jgi:hypothetical protein
MNSPIDSTELDRVRRYTAPELLQKIDDRIEASVRFYSTQSDEAIRRRIEELDREWDMERYLETNASAVVVTTALLGLTVSKKWFLLTATAGAFLFQHAVKGWCPPIPLFRRLGVRTRREIDREKFALKALRGDFKDLPSRPTPDPQLATRTLEAVKA